MRCGRSLLAILTLAVIGLASSAADSTSASAPVPAASTVADRSAAATARRARQKLHHLLDAISPRSDSERSRGSIPITARFFQRFVLDAPRVYSVVLLISTRRTSSVDCEPCKLIAPELQLVANAYHAHIHRSAVEAAEAAVDERESDGDGGDESAGGDDNTPLSGGKRSSSVRWANSGWALSGPKSYVFFLEVDAWDERTLFRDLGLRSVPHLYFIAPSSNDGDAGVGSASAAGISIASFFTHPNVSIYNTGPSPPAGTIPAPNSGLRAEQIIRFVHERSGRIATAAPPPPPPPVAIATTNTAADNSTRKQRRHRTPAAWRQRKYSGAFTTGDETAAFPPFDRTEWGGVDYATELESNERNAAVRRSREAISSALIRVAVVLVFGWIAYKLWLIATPMIYTFIVGAVYFFCTSGGWYVLITGSPLVSMTKTGEPAFVSPSPTAMFGGEGISVAFLNLMSAILFGALTVAIRRSPPPRPALRVGVRRSNAATPPGGAAPDLNTDNTPTRARPDALPAVMVDDEPVVGSFVIALTAIVLYVMFAFLRTLYAAKNPNYLRPQ